METPAEAEQEEAPAAESETEVVQEDKSAESSSETAPVSETDTSEAQAADAQKSTDQTAVDHGHGGGKCAVLGSHVDNVLSTCVLSHNAPLYDKEKHIGKVWVLLRHYSTHPYPGRQCESEKINYFLEKKRGASKPS